MRDRFLALFEDHVIRDVGQGMISMKTPIAFVALRCALNLVRP